VWGLALIVPSAAAIWLGSWGLLAYRQIFLSPSCRWFTLAVVFTVLTTMRFLRADRQVRERTRKLALTQDAIIQSLAALTETRHHETGGHIQRTRHYIRVLAGRLQTNARFRTGWTMPPWIPLSDSPRSTTSGRSACADRILLKPARLTPEEFEEMKRHTLYRVRDDPAGETDAGGRRLFPDRGRSRPQPHERWVATGYPNG